MGFAIYEALWDDDDDDDKFYLFDLIGRYVELFDSIMNGLLVIIKIIFVELPQFRVIKHPKRLEYVLDLAELIIILILAGQQLGERRSGELMIPRVEGLTVRNFEQFWLTGSLISA